MDASNMRIDLFYFSNGPEHFRLRERKRTDDKLESGERPARGGAERGVHVQ